MIPILLTLLLGSFLSMDIQPITKIPSEPGTVVALPPWPTEVEPPDLTPYISCRGSEWTDKDQTNGYINPLNRFCIPGIPTVESWFIKQPEFIYGTAVYYNPGIMLSTTRYRGMEYPEGYLGGVALGSPGEMGETVWLHGPLGWEGPFLVVDCPQLVDVYTTIVINQQAVEVDFNTALRWGMVEWKNPYDKAQGHTVISSMIDPILVWKGETLPDDIRYKIPTNFASWWLDHMEFSSVQEDRPFYKEGEGNTLWWRFDRSNRDEEWVCFTCN